MKYKITILTVSKLIKMYKEGKLNLNPPYQRNEIWPIKAKQKLIESIESNFPIPNLFLYKTVDSKYEVVDGQQRARAIFGFYNKLFPNLIGEYYNFKNAGNFKKYRFPTVVINEIEPSESIERFYALVNSTGLKLNRPELKKAEYFDTRFLTLLEELSISKEFESLNLFSSTSLDRMNDIDFVGELVSLLEYGITEKKIGMDKLFDNDITVTKRSVLFKKFINIIEIFNEFNEIYPLKNSRYKQKNDFYTLFDFVNKNIKINQDNFNYFYKILILIGEDIFPQNDDCEPFKEYAYHCVTQSNSKYAREQRLKFLNLLLLNRSNKVNSTQKAILEFYGFNNLNLRKIDKYYTLDLEKLQKKVGQPLLII